MIGTIQRERAQSGHRQGSTMVLVAPQSSLHPQSFNVYTFKLFTIQLHVIDFRIS
jgi:hypothetical protein